MHDSEVQSKHIFLVSIKYWICALILLFKLAAVFFLASQCPQTETQTTREHSAGNCASVQSNDTYRGNKSLQEEAAA